MAINPELPFEEQIPCPATSECSYADFCRLKQDKGVYLKCHLYKQRVAETLQSKPEKK